MFVGIIKAADLGWLATNNDQQSYQRLSQTSERVRFPVRKRILHFRFQWPWPMTFRSQICSFGYSCPALHFY